MYLDFYGFDREPFHITPDPEFLYLSPSHKEAFATVVYGVEQRKGFVALTGEVGTGKTTILRAYIKRIERTPTRPIYLFNPDLTFDELLRLVLREMGAEDQSGSASAMLDRLQWLLINEYKAGHNVALIIDEAQNMPVETLEKLRMLSNLETAKDKLIQIVLVGQPELEQKLELHALRQLRERIAVRATIRMLTRAESYEYVRYRMTQAGCLRENVFAKDALRRIVAKARGNPRLLNILCDNALIAGFGAFQQTVSAKIVRQVIADVLGNARQRRLRLAGVGAALFLLAAGLTVGLAFASFEEGRSQSATLGTTDAGVPPAVPDAVQEERQTPQDAPQGPQPGQAGAPLAETTDSAGQVAAPAGGVEPKMLDHKVVALRKMEEAFAETPASLRSRETPAEPAPDAVADAVSVAAGPAPVETVPAVAMAAAAAEAVPAVAAEEPTPAEAAAPSAEAPRPIDANFAPQPVPAPGSGPPSEPQPGDMRAMTPAKAEAAPAGMVARHVKVGDCLTRLVAETYGRSSAFLVETVRRANPRIENADIIWSGDTLLFPERIVDELGVEHTASIPEASFVGE
ncbi:MAG: AAA family ATPase [Candidatus Hydrogenedentes bacterium]|nr:AAA family ATPase [Candidatus Hydrogenedentota bacterium]